MKHVIGVIPTMSDVVYFGHHRSASTYTHNVIRSVCQELGWPLAILHSAQPPDGGFDRGSGRARSFFVYTNAEVRLLHVLGGCRGFHVVRDPRDIVVSSYYSHLYSHPTKHWPALVAHRRHLESLSKDEGLLYEIETCRRGQFAAMDEWDYSSPDVLELRMEDLVQSPLEVFLRIFRFLDMVDEEDSTSGRRVRRLIGAANRRVWRFGNGASLRLRHRPLERAYVAPLQGIQPERLEAILKRHQFARKSDGRSVGDEDVRSHYRKGTAGDWRHHFKAAHVGAFKARYNDLLVKLGYESDDCW